MTLTLTDDQIKAARSLRPHLDRVLIQPDEPPKRTKGGLYLPDATQGKPEEKPLKGTVLAVGPGGSNKFGLLIIPAWKPGNRVYYSQWAGGTVILDERTFLICRDEDILCEIVDGPLSEAEMLDPAPANVLRQVIRDEEGRCGER